MEMHKRKGFAAMLAAAGGLIAVAPHSKAATDSFNGAAGDNNYLTAGNWSAARVPTIASGDTVGTAAVAGTAANLTINLAGAAPNVLDVRFANNTNALSVTFNVSNGASLTVIGDLPGATGSSVAGQGFEFGRSVGATGTVNMTGGLLATAADDPTGEFGVGQLANATGFGSGFLNMSGGTISVAQNFAVGDQQNTGGQARGTVVQSGGSITAGGTAGAGSIYVGNNGIGNYTMTGGALSQVGTGTNFSGSAAGVANTNTSRVGMFVGRSTNGVGTFTQSGGIVSLANGLYVGDGVGSKGIYTISGGALNIAGEVRVAPSANESAVTLTGNTGTFSIVGNGAPQINASSLVADTAGSTLNFTMNSSAGTTLLDLAAGTVGGIAYDGIAHLSGSTNIDVDNAAGFTPAAGSRFTLLTAASISALPTLVQDGDAFDGGALSIVTNPDTTQSLVITTAATPEPAGLAAMVLGGTLAVRRRRKRNA